MKILGLQGVYPRSHDASACLIDTQVPAIEGLALEENFTRQKKAFDAPPANATTFILETAGVDVNDIDVITTGWKRGDRSAKDVLPPQYGSQLNKEIPFEQVQHHEAHAASAFYTSPFSEAAVLVVDGQGENESTSIWRGDKNGLTQLASYPVDKSLGYMYGAVSKYCGLGTFGAGKLMGLAPYGVPKYVDDIAAIYDRMPTFPHLDRDQQDRYYEEFLEGLRQRGLPAAVSTYEYNDLSHKTRKMPVLEDVHRDLAASTQVFLETKMLELAREAKALTGSDNLCMAGGVAMNCVTNSVIQDSGIFKEMFLQPGCEDSGVSLGSALAVGKTKMSLDTVYTGPSFSDDEIAQWLETRGIKGQRHEDIAAAVAKLVAEGNIVGWFQGGLEYGPRALGSRSIIANPGDPGMKDKVNAVKSREPWRPFGPSVLAEAADDLFENPHASPYMLRSFQVRPEWQSKMPAIVHVDGSTRPQTVTEAANPRYYRMIRAFKGLTGLPGVLNTSFNNFDEPIVSSPDDAIKTFYTSGLDALAIGSHLVVKEK